MAGMLPTPRALLLDFGGVIVDGPDQPGWHAELVVAVNELLAAAAVAPLPPEAILEPLAAGAGGGRFWLGQAPTQPDHRSLWGDGMAADWPPAARAAVLPHATVLSRRYMEARHAAGWQLRPGMAELLADAAARGLPVAVVSNTLFGATHREFLDRAGLAGRFVAQFYSDEEGIRKPNPELARRAVAAVGVPAAECWFVGDTLSRDVLVARRAGIGAAILMRSLRVERPPHPDGVAPDASVADPVELHALLRAYYRG
jgi:HAD superfamily hydrolase (TIGR01509 family)